MALHAILENDGVLLVVDHRNSIVEVVYIVVDTIQIVAFDIAPTKFVEELFLLRRSEAIVTGNFLVFGNEFHPSFTKVSRKPGVLIAETSCNVVSILV